MVTMETATNVSNDVGDNDNPTYDLGVVEGAMWVYEILTDFILADELDADIHDLHAYIDYRVKVRLAEWM